MALIDILALFLTAIIWGVNFAIVKLGMDQMPPIFLSAMRFSVVALAIFFVPRPKVNWTILVGIATFIGVIKFTLIFVAMDIGFGAGLSSVVVQGQVFFTIILTFFLYGEQIGFIKKIGLVIGFFGLAIMGFDEGSGFNLLGFFMVVLGALSWAAANMFFRKSGGHSPGAVIIWASVYAMAPIWLLSLYFEGADTIFNTVTNLNLKSVGVILFASFASTLFAYGVWGKMLSKYPAADVTPFALLVPVSGLLGGIILLGETISLLAQIGIGAIMIGLAITIFSSRIGAATPPGR